MTGMQTTMQMLIKYDDSKDGDGGHGDHVENHILNEDNKYYYISNS